MILEQCRCNATDRLVIARTQCVFERGSSRGSEIAGLSINWRLDDEETVLLISLGMRVINDGRAEQISDRLRHYAWHLGGFATGRLGRAKRDRCPEELDGEAKNR